MSIGWVTIALGAIFVALGIWQLTLSPPSATIEINGALTEATTRNYPGIATQEHPHD